MIAVSALSAGSWLARSDILKQRQEELSDQALLLAYEQAKAELETAKGIHGRIEQEIFKRMDERGATAIPDDTFTCGDNPVNGYDDSLLVMLREHIGQDELESSGAFIPEHDETKTIAAKWDVVKVKKLAKQYGTECNAIVDRARFTKNRGLTFKRKPIKDD
jgi:hypothetical protein